MMSRVLYEQDADLAPLAAKTVAVIGYGSQGEAQALCLRDSGVAVIVGTVREPSEHRARQAGFGVFGIAEAVRRADVLLLLLPDELHGRVFRELVRPALRAGQTLCFAHGFSIVFGQVQPPPDVDVVMVSPKGPGPQLREAYVAGGGLAGLIAIHQDASGQARATALALAKALGLTRSGCLECRFSEETYEDLFGEQCVLCGGAVQLMRYGFEVLVEAGYPPEIAYFECIHELKLIVDLVHARGFRGMNEVISNTAEWGEYTVGPQVLGPDVKARMKEALHAIESGAFARDWVAEFEQGCGRLLAHREALAEHPMEQTGNRLRREFKRPGSPPAPGA